jgi:hypothetical protein
MSKTTLAAIIGIASIIAAVAINLPPAPANAQMAHEDHSPMHAMAPDKDAKTPPSAPEGIYARHLPMVSASIDNAIKALSTNDKKTALAELNKAKAMLAMIETQVAKLTKPKFANTRCPIMGSPIDPDKVSDDLTRDFKGQKIAFCCKGCPSQWDSLTDTQKADKLASAQPAPQQLWTCPMHSQIKLPKPGSCPICRMRLTPLAQKQDHTGHNH